jgi:hypothetical protein
MKICICPFRLFRIRACKLVAPACLLLNRISFTLKAHVSVARSSLLAKGYNCQTTAAATTHHKADIKIWHTVSHKDTETEDEHALFHYTRYIYS